MLALGAKDGVAMRHSGELFPKRREDPCSLKGHIGFLVPAKA